MGKGAPAEQHQNHTEAVQLQISATPGTANQTLSGGPPKLPPQGCQMHQKVLRASDGDTHWPGKPAHALHMCRPAQPGNHLHQQYPRTHSRSAKADHPSRGQVVPRRVAVTPANRNQLRTLYDRTPNIAVPFNTGQPGVAWYTDSCVVVIQGNRTQKFVAGSICTSSAIPSSWDCSYQHLCLEPHPTKAATICQ